MIELIMLVGFLGAGKTTLLNKIIGGSAGRRLGILVNDFGRLNIDAAAIRLGGFECADLTNGSIFCACIKDDFVRSLIDFSRLDIDCLIVEASGLSDPSSLEKIIGDISPLLKRRYVLKSTVCLIDCKYFAGMLDIFPAVRRQVEYGSYFILNKADLCDAGEIDNVIRLIGEIKPGFAYTLARRCDIDIERAVFGNQGERAAPRDSLNTPDSRLVSVTLTAKAAVSADGLERLLRSLMPHTYRIKGYTDTERGCTQISCVGRQLEMTVCRQNMPSGIVIISSVGIKIYSVLASALKEMPRDVFEVI